MKRWIYYIQQFMSAYLNHLFTDPGISQQLMQKGYAVVNICDKTDVDLIADKTKFLLSSFSPATDQFFNFGQLDNFDMRNLSYELIQKEVLPLFQSLLNSESKLYAGTHLIKPPGERSGFDPHQDNTMVDETKYRSYIIWMPLTEITAENGAVCLLPKSHRLGNLYRAVSIPWIYRDVKELIQNYSKPVLLRAGQALIFDSELIHYSLPNLSAETRIAVNAMAIPKNAAIIKCIYKKFWLKKFVDIYEVGMEYYLNQANENKPAADFRKIASVVYDRKKMSTEKLSQMLTQLA